MLSAVPRAGGLVASGARVCLAFALLVPLRSQAQQVRGVLRAEISGAPTEGVVVTAMRAADRAIVGRALSSATGSFRLGVGPDSVIVMALRIGQRPVELWRGRLLPGAQQDIGQALPDVPVSITTLRVRERARCGANSADDASVTRALFADALTALSASVGTSDDADLVVRSVATEEFRDLRGRVLRVSPSVARSDTRGQPFRSVDVHVLMREGFVVRERDGGTTFRAPDAQVLTADAFLARYCLSLDLSREADGLVGITFAPEQTSQTRVDVRGTLWLDLPTRALQRLEFGYVGLTRVMASADPGGRVEFVQLADGRWIIDRWSLRMPTLTTELVALPYAGTRVERSRAIGTQVTGGTVLEARLRGALVYSVGGRAAERAISGLVDSSASSTGAAPALANRAGSPVCANAGAANARIAGVVRRTDGTPVEGARVEAEWRSTFRNVAGQSWAWELANATSTTSPDGTFALCDVPRDARVSVQARTEDARSRMMQLRLPASGALGEIELTMPAARRVP